MRPEGIFARRTRFAYGLETNNTFRPGMPEALKYLEPSLNKTCCQNYFTRYIGHDQLVEHDQVGTDQHPTCVLRLEIVGLYEGPPYGMQTIVLRITKRIISFVL